MVEEARAAFAKLEQRKPDAPEVSALRDEIHAASSRPQPRQRLKRYRLNRQKFRRKWRVRKPKPRLTQARSPQPKSLPSPRPVRWINLSMIWSPRSVRAFCPKPQFTKLRPSQLLRLTRSRTQRQTRSRKQMARCTNSFLISKLLWETAFCRKHLWCRLKLRSSRLTRLSRQRHKCRPRRWRKQRHHRRLQPQWQPALPSLPRRPQPPQPLQLSPISRRGCGHWLPKARRRL